MDPPRPSPVLGRRTALSRSSGGPREREETKARAKNGEAIDRMLKALKASGATSLPRPNSVYRPVMTVAPQREEEDWNNYSEADKKEVEIRTLRMRILQLEEEAKEPRRRASKENQIQGLEEKLKISEGKLKDAEKEIRRQRNTLRVEGSQKKNLEELVKKVYGGVIDLSRALGNFLGAGITSSSLAVLPQGGVFDLEKTVHWLMTQHERMDEDDIAGGDPQVLQELEFMKIFFQNLSQSSAESPAIEHGLPSTSESASFERSTPVVIAMTSCSQSVSSTTPSTPTHEGVKLELSEPVIIGTQAAGFVPDVYEDAEHVIVSVQGSPPASTPQQDILPSKESVPSRKAAKKTKKTPKEKKHHQFDESKADQGWFCECSLKFRSKELLQHHVKYFTAAKLFPCRLNCGEKFIGASHLKKHMLSKHKVKIGVTHGCRDCGECFGTKSELSLHRRRCHPRPRQRSKVPPPKQVVISPTVQIPPEPVPLMSSAFEEQGQPLPVSAPALSLSPVKLELAKEEPTSPPNFDSEPGNFEHLAPAPLSQQYYGSPSPSQDVVDQFPRNNSQSQLSFADELIQMAGRESQPTDNTKMHGVDEARSHLGPFCICGSLSTSVRGLQHHIWYNNGGLKLPCTHCPRIFAGNSYLAKHLYSAHKIIPSPPIPGIRAGLQRALNRRPRGQPRRSNLQGGDTPGTRYACKSCGLQLGSLKSLRRHMIRKHNAPSKGAVRGCRECDLVFDTQMELLKHQKSVHNSNLGVPAPTEEHGFVDVAELKSVSLSMVKSETPSDEPVPPTPANFPCQCGKKFYFKKTLIRHIDARSKGKGKLFKCPCCPRRLVNHCSLKNHMASFHPEVGYNKNFGCRRCGSTFETQAQLIYHSRTLHREIQL